MPWDDSGIVSPWRHGPRKRCAVSIRGRQLPGACFTGERNDPGTEVTLTAYLTVFASDAGGTKDIARSASAVMVSAGFTPGLAEMAEPSITYSPS